MARCAFTKDDGQQCGARVPEGRRFCIWHDPDRAEEAAKARRLGGLQSSATQRKTRIVPEEDMALEPPQTARDAREWASWVTFAVATGKIDRATAGQINTSLKTFMTGLSKEELEREAEARVADQIDAMEEEIRKLKARNGGAHG